MLYEYDREVQDQVLEFYKNLLEELESWRPTVDGLEFTCLDETERLSLEREFDKEEILVVLKETEGDKALGLDGFTMGFVQKC